MLALPADTVTERGIISILNLFSGSGTISFTVISVESSENSPSGPMARQVK